MTVYSLNLQIDQLGMTASIIRTKLGRPSLEASCEVRYADLSQPDKDTITDPVQYFEPGLNKIAETINITRCKTAALYLSPCFFSFRVLTFPFSSKHKIKQSLKFELEPLLPFEHEPYVSDFEIIQTRNEETKIFTGSVLNSHVETYIQGLNSKGIQPVVIAPNGYGFAKSLIDKKKFSDSFIFVQVQKHEIIIVVIVGQKPFSVRSFSMAEPGDIEKMISQTITGLEQSHGVNNSFDIIISNGDPSSLTDPAQTLLANLQNSQGLYQLKIKTIHVLDAIDTDSSNFYHKKVLNFCKDRYGSIAFFKSYTTHLTLAIALAILAFSLSIFTIRAENQSLESHISMMEQNIAQIYTDTFPLVKKIQDPYLELKAQVVNLEKKSTSATNGSNRGKNVKTIDIVLALSDQIPASINCEISRLSVNESRLIVTGSTDNFNDIEIMKKNLETHGLFKIVKISSATMDKSGKQVNFKYIIEL